MVALPDWNPRSTPSRTIGDSTEDSIDEVVEMLFKKENPPRIIHQDEVVWNFSLSARRANSQIDFSCIHQVRGVKVGLRITPAVGKRNKVTRALICSLKVISLLQSSFQVKRLDVIKDSDLAIIKTQVEVMSRGKMIVQGKDEKLGKGREEKKDEERGKGGKGGGLTEEVREVFPSNSYYFSFSERA